MKRYKILTAVMAAAVLGGASAMAQFNYQNGDLLAAFGNGTGPDVIVNLGPISSFQSGSAFSQNLGSVLTTEFGGVSSSVYWAVFGINDTTVSPQDSATQASPYTVWATLPRSNPSVENDTPTVSGNVNSQHLAANQIKTIANLTTPGAANPGLIQDLAPGVEAVSVSLGGFTPLVNSGSEPLAGNLGDTWAYDILNSGAGMSDLYQSDPGSPVLNSQTYLGSFSLDPSGTLTFNPVPEPGTFALLGAGAVALLAVRRRKQS